MVTVSDMAGQLPVGLEMHARRWSEGDDLRLTEQLTDSARLFVDVGANAGLYSWAARRQGAPVLAVEPHPVMAQRLRDRLPDLEVAEVALSEEPGHATLFVPAVGHDEITTRSSLEEGANEGYGHRSIKVELRPLDDVLKPHPTPVGFLKIDVEGHEDQVLRGATTTLAEDRPVVLIEIEWRHHGGDAQRLISFLVDQGYEGGFLFDGRHHPITTFVAERLQSVENLKGPGVRIGRRAPYVNNFFFIHVDDEAARHRLDDSRFVAG